jgi:hypothetical protein
MREILTAMIVMVGILAVVCAGMYLGLTIGGGAGAEVYPRG